MASEHPRTHTALSGKYDGSVETWASYIERFELYVDCNSIDAGKKVSTLLTVIGVKTYSLLRDLCTPNKPSEKTFNELVQLVQKHLFPTPSFIAERYRFSKRVQLEGESVAEYIANLKKMTTHCDFGASLNDYLRDRLVSGIRSESAKQKLLSEASLTFEQATKIVLSMEQAEKSAAALSVGRPERIHQLSSVVARRGRFGNGAPHSQTHSQTARSDNAGAAWKGAGGTAKVSGGTSPGPSGWQRRSPPGGSGSAQCLCCGLNQVSGDTEEFVDDVANLFRMNEKVTDRVKVDPIQLDLIVNGKSLTFEVDTGASAFDRVKELLSSETILAHYDGKLPLKLAVDASSFGLGAVLSVCHTR
ncbi:uncharacterized protein LOC124374746, partial [Homalodisca vitripennis]|uniref:uncharacterized protein LOC124374746 n=1 Tax=Homalodisca vitripennis TaxID=197043 RepID=UPI001EEBE6DD